MGAADTAERERDAEAAAKRRVEREQRIIENQIADFACSAKRERADQAELDVRCLASSRTYGTATTPVPGGQSAAFARDIRSSPT